MVTMETPYNPLDKIHLGESVAGALLRQSVVSLGEIQSFDGAGIYCIYYKGGLDLYRSISQDGSPIYVGKAIPPGSRKGALGIGAPSKLALFKRLKEHADSIELSNNLDLKDFACRYLVVEDIWIPLGESLLIATFSPLWNRLIDGFGNHDPGKGRYKQLRSRWDTLHPGRTWALKCVERQETADQIRREVSAYLAAF